MFRCLSDLRINGQILRAGDLFPCPENLVQELIEAGAIEKILNSEVSEFQEMKQEAKKRKVKKAKNGLLHNI